MDEGRSHVPSLRMPPFAKGNPRTEWVGLMDCLWLRGFWIVPQSSRTPPVAEPLGSASLLPRLSLL